MEKDNIDVWLKNKLELELKTVGSKPERRMLIREVRRYADMLNLGGRLTPALQMVYYRMAFDVFDYLRRKGQLRQTRQVFDTEVYTKRQHFRYGRFLRHAADFKVFRGHA